MANVNPACAFCGEPVSLTDGTYRQVTGWVQYRQGGGGHAIRLASAPTAFAHPWCIDTEARHGVTQPSLFGDG